MNAKGILGYATYVPRHRVQRAELGATLGITAGRGARVVAAFDEDSTTIAVEAASTLLREQRSADEAVPDSLYFATTSPAYFDKTNATAAHAALGLPAEVFATDLAGSARSGIAAWRAAAASGGLAVLSDVRTGRPGSADELGGGDGAAAYLFGDGDSDAAIARILAHRSVTAELLDRWRAPGAAAGGQWEERFGLEIYLPLVRQAAAAALDEAGLEQAQHVVLVSPNSAVAKRGAKTVSGSISTVGSPIGHAGTADVGLALADVLDRAAPGETILVVSAADGCDVMLLRTTERITRARQAKPVSEQVADGIDVPYGTYLGWRGLLDREPPRRPEPDRPAGPPSARSVQWKFSFTGTVCRRCSFVHLPPVRVCKKCGVVDEMDSRRLAGAAGTVATYTVDRLAYSPSPPLIEAVVDFDEGGRYTLEVADATPEQLSVGTRVELTFRRLYTSGGIHNYFWKARLTSDHTDGADAEEAVAAAGGRA